MHNALAPETQPWVELGKCLGLLLGSLGADATKGCQVDVYGMLYNSI